MANYKPKFHDLTGQTYGRLTVIGRAQNKKNREAAWLCKCECGNNIVVAAQNLKRGRTKSCGCLYEEGKHRKSNTRLYRIWCNMKTRCQNPNGTEFDSYGGKGVSVCEEWQKSFSIFYDWAVSNGYSDGLSIDRIDVNGDYCPNNCKWSTYKEQGNNKGNNHLITFNGKTQTIAQWADEIGVKRSTLHARINYYHWDIEKALTTKTEK